MGDITNLPSLGGGKKDFWNRPEGNFGTIVAGVLGVGIIAMIFTFSDFLAKAASNLFSFVGNIFGVGIIAIVAYAIFRILKDPRFRELIEAKYQGVITKMYRAFVKSDPVAVADRRIKELKGRSAEAELNLAELNGVINGIERDISTNNREIDRNTQLANTAKDTGDEQSAAQIMASSVVPRKNSNENLTRLLLQLKLSYKTLSKIKENTDWVIKAMIEHLDVLKKEFKASKAGMNVLRKTKSILGDNSAGQEMYEMSIEEMIAQCDAFTGEMERFQESNKDLMKTFDLQKMADQKEGLKILEEMNQKVNALDFKKPVFNIIPTTMQEKEKVPVTNPTQSNTKFNFFKK